MAGEGVERGNKFHAFAMALFLLVLAIITASGYLVICYVAVEHEFMNIIYFCDTLGLVITCLVSVSVVAFAIASHYTFYFPFWLVAILWPIYIAMIDISLVIISLILTNLNTSIILFLAGVVLSITAYAISIKYPKLARLNFD